MKWTSASSDMTGFEDALIECTEKIKKDLKKPIDLCLLFVSSHYSGYYEQIPDRIKKLLNPKMFIGCSAGGVIGGGREIEQQPAISITCASLPKVELTSFHISNDDLPGLDARRKHWQDLIGVDSVNDTHFILLTDPFTLDANQFILGMDYAFPKSTKIGGLASGGTKAYENALFLNSVMHLEGTIGVALSGNIVADSVVAQGCRPIGEPMVVTSCDHNILSELNDKPPMKILEDIFETLPERDQQLLRTSLFLGLVMDPTMTTYNRGDFLIRNILGADPEKGILSVGADLRAGQTVQFHLRDAETSAEDLDLMLSNYSSKHKKAEVKGGLLFSCMGRGVYLYGSPDHDSNVFKKNLGSVPLGGFFCNGEVGPVKNTTYIHGYTSCFGIFREKKKVSKS